MSEAATREEKNPASTDLATVQTAFFRSGRTRSAAFRRTQLRRLEQVVRDSTGRILDGLRADLGKPAYEGYLTEVGFVLDEIRFARKRLAQWMRPRRVPTPAVHWPAVSRIYSEPYGRALIIAPWNYPFQLAMAPLVGAMAAGNCCVLKPSELAPATSRIITELIGQTFPPHYVCAVEGGVAVSAALLEAGFDIICFTGSARVGRKIMSAAAPRLTPVILELGGKSPCIVAADADLSLAARRIVSGKFMNAGQTCIAPDYVVVDGRVEAVLVKEICHQVRVSFGETPESSPDYGRLVTPQHFDRLAGMLDSSRGQIVIGGGRNRSNRFLAPTVLTQVAWTDPVMEDEIFGPILPVIACDRLTSAIDAIRRRPRPLACYVFSGDRRLAQQLIREVPFGGGCINDTLLHIANPHLPFGGVGSSGMGRYHGKAGFDAFSFEKGVMERTFLPDMPLRYPPYAKRPIWLLRWLIGGKP